MKLITALIGPIALVVAFFFFACPVLLLAGSFMKGMFAGI